MDTHASYKVLGDGTQKVTTPGTAVQLTSTATPCREVHVTAFLENAGPVVVGASTVLATVGSRRGRALAPGETAAFAIQDVSLLYIDALNANEGVSYAYFKQTS